MRIGSLCTGYGGLDMAVGGDLAFVSDIDPHVNRLLETRYPGVPNIGDITDQPDAPQVDAITAGFPCQPVSTAGRRKGTDDERWIFDDILALAGRMDPLPVLYLENVPGLLSANGGDAMARVVEGLAALGYVGRYRLLRASDVGACHRRERWFCIAYPDGVGHVYPGTVGSERREPPQQAQGGSPTTAHSGGSGAGMEGPNPGRPGRQPARVGESTLVRPGHREADAEGARASLPTPRTSDTNGAGRHGTGGLDLRTAIDTLPTPRATRGGSATETVNLLPRWGDYADAINRHTHTIGREPPTPTVDGRLSPAFVEWMMMLPAGWVTDLDLSRTAQLKILGNGVVPPQAATAFHSLT